MNLRTLVPIKEKSKDRPIGIGVEKYNKVGDGKYNKVT